MAMANDLDEMEAMAQPNLESLLGKESAVGKKAGLSTKLDRGTLKKYGKQAAGLFILSQLLGAFNKNREQSLQRGAIRDQAELATPENLYYQAAQPQAQQEEAEARQALITHLSGGVIGPSVATGERLIGV